VCIFIEGQRRSIDVCKLTPATAHTNVPHKRVTTKKDGGGGGVLAGWARGRLSLTLLDLVLGGEVKESLVSLVRVKNSPPSGRTVKTHDIPFVLVLLLGRSAVLGLHFCGDEARRGCSPEAMKVDEIVEGAVGDHIGANEEHVRLHPMGTESAAGVQRGSRGRRP